MYPSGIPLWDQDWLHTKQKKNQERITSSRKHAESISGTDRLLNILCLANNPFQHIFSPKALQEKNRVWLTHPFLLSWVIRAGVQGSERYVTPGGS